MAKEIVIEKSDCLNDTKNRFSLLFLYAMIILSHFCETFSPTLKYSQAYLSHCQEWNDRDICNARMHISPISTNGCSKLLGNNRTGFTRGRHTSLILDRLHAINGIYAM